MIQQVLAAAAWHRLWRMDGHLVIYPRLLGAGGQAQPQRSRSKSAGALRVRSTSRVTIAEDDGELRTLRVKCSGSHSSKGTQVGPWKLSVDRSVGQGEAER